MWFQMAFPCAFGRLCEPPNARGEPPRHGRTAAWVQPTIGAVGSSALFGGGRTPRPSDAPRSQGARRRPARLRHPARAPRPSSPRATPLLVGTTLRHPPPRGPPNARGERRATLESPTPTTRCPLWPVRSSALFGGVGCPLAAPPQAPPASAPARERPLRDHRSRGHEGTTTPQSPLVLPPTPTRRPPGRGTPP